MASEIQVPLEFLVHGTPVSVQAKRADSRAAWKARVKRASSDVLPDAHFSTRSALSVTLFYFPDAAMKGDIDNIVKLVLDALCRHVYRDDDQVERVLVQKFEPGKVFQFSDPSDVLTQALRGDKPLLFVRLSDNPTEELV